MTTKRITIELPDDLLTILGWREEEIQTKIKETLVMALLREHKLSQRKAAELLWLTYRELLALMTQYHIPSIDYEDSWLDHELDVFAKDWNNEADAIYDNWEEHYKDRPIRVRVKDGKLVPLEPLNIPDGTILLLKIIPTEEMKRDIAEAVQEVRQSKKSPELPSWPGHVKGTLSREEIYEDITPPTSAHRVV